LEQAKPRAGWDREAALAECAALVRARLPEGWNVLAYVDTHGKLVLSPYVQRYEAPER
jgi:hypothetical protein